MKTSLIAVAAVAAAGALYLGGVKSAPHAPSDLRDAVSDSSFDTLNKEAGAAASDIKVPEPGIKPFYVETGSGRGRGNKGHVGGNNPSAGAPADTVDYITINGGKFLMGSDSDDEFFDNCKPVHEVTIKTFQMAKTAVTVAQYAECVNMGVCTEPATGSHCNWDDPDSRLHPVNCVEWSQAKAYAKFKGNGARLPSEAEFEYAARSRGRSQKYPWGNNEPTSRLAVFNTEFTMPVCSKPKGNTAQGLCDMSGNVWQWVQDRYQRSYEGVPTDGSAFEGPGSSRVMRGGSFKCDEVRLLQADYRSLITTGFRNEFAPYYRYEDVGFRLARSIR